MNGLLKSEDADYRQIRQALERLSTLLQTKDPAILAEFTGHDDVVLIGSEAGEIIEGTEAFVDFFRRLLALPVRLAWEWKTVRISREGEIAWVFANGEVVIRNGEGEKRAPYRMTGVLKQHDGQWRWRLFHGSEPAK